MRNILLSILFLSVTLASSAQEVVGVITDDQETKLAFANVLLFNALDSSFVKGTMSDEQGRFQFSQLTKGRYYLEASMLGYQSYHSGPFVLDENLNDLFQHQVKLETNVEVMEAVDIVAKKPLFEQKMDRTVVNVQNSVTATGSTALEILERSPGINVDRLNNQIGMQGKQGVIVMLNGKRMRMDMQAVIQLLQSMPSDNIEKIELIATPPASFDAEGDAGIINIETILREDEGLHMNGALNAGYGQRGKYGASINWNYRKNKVNLYGDLSTNQNYSQEDANISRTNTFNSQVSRINTLSNRPAFTGLNNGKVGLDLYLNERLTIGGLFSAYYRHWDLDAQTLTNIQSVDGRRSAALKTHEINNWAHWMGNLNIRYQFEDQSSLTFDYDHLEYDDDNPVNYAEEVFDEENNLLSSQAFNSWKSTPIQFDVFKLDYAKQWSPNLSFEVGLKATLSDFTNDVGVERLQNDEMLIDPQFTDIYRLDEKIGAAYFSTDYQVTEKLSAKAGLRYEYYDSDLGSDAEGPLIVQAFGRLFPSLFLSYQLDEQKQLQLSYSERITRPAFTTIAPAFFFWDSNTILAGNPAVRPTISRRLSMSYRQGSLLFTAAYSDDDNPIVWQPRVDASQSQVITGAVNMPDRKTWMLTMNMPIQISKWWESRYNVSYFWQRLQPIYEGEIYAQTASYVMANTSQNFSLPKDFSLEVNANWASRIRFGLGEVLNRGMINIGVQKPINDRMKLSLNWNDVFDMGSFWDVRFQQADVDLDYRMYYQMEGNVFRLNLSWQLGNTKVKSRRERATGSEEERNRLN